MGGRGPKDFRRARAEIETRFTTDAPCTAAPCGCGGRTGARRAGRNGPAVTPCAATSPLTFSPTGRLPSGGRGDPAGENVRLMGLRMPYTRETHSSRRFAAVPVAWSARPCGRQGSRPSPTAGSPHLPSGCRPSGGKGRRSIHGTRRARRAVPSGATGACMSTDGRCRPRTRAGRTPSMSSQKSDDIKIWGLLESSEYPHEPISKSAAHAVPCSRL